MGITRYLKLPFYFDSGPLREELKSFSDKNWIMHFNKRDYEGKWKCISLMGQPGQEESIIVTHNNTLAQPSKYLSLLPSFQSIIHSFQCPIISARLMNLHGGAHIKPHCDNNMGYADGVIRLHIPVATNDKVQFILDGECIHMKPGECWYTNVNFEHSVTNEGESNRIHLVIDCLRNDWTDSIFFQLVEKESLLEHKRKKYDIDTIQQIITELKQHGTPTAEKLINDLKKELQVLQKVIP